MGVLLCSVNLKGKKKSEREIGGYVDRLRGSDFDVTSLGLHYTHCSSRVGSN